MDVQRRDFLLTGTLAAAAAAAAPALAQTTAQPAADPPGQARGGTVRPGDENVQYQGGTDVKRLRIINSAELEIEAEKVLPAGGYGYIFGGSGAEYTKRENLRAMEAIGIEPQFLSGVLKPDLSTTILGHKLPFPIVVPPMGSHGLAHVSKEIGTARGVAATGTLMILAMQSNIPLEEVAAANPGPKWMQLYFPADRGYAREVIMRAKAAGYSAIVPTIDSTSAYPRDNNIRNNFRIPLSLGKGNAPVNEPDPIKGAAIMNRRKIDLNFDDLVWIKEQTGLPVIPKGVMSPRTARQAIERGLDAGLCVEPWRTRAGRRARGDHAAAAYRRRGAGPRADRLRFRHPAGTGCVPRAGPGRECGGERSAHHVRARARRTLGRAERARVSARRPLHRDAACRHARRRRHHQRLRRALVGAGSLVPWQGSTHPSRRNTRRVGKVLCRSVQSAIVRVPSQQVPYDEECD
jgi:L-lactate oxidase